MVGKGGLMKKSLSLFFFFLLIPAVLWAGEIYGSIREGGKAIGPGVRIEVLFSGKTYATQTDPYGSYRIYIPGKGRGMLKVYYGGQPATLVVFSYDRSVRYDLFLKKQGGRYSLRRE
jgi:hypothetical protein